MAPEALFVFHDIGTFEEYRSVTVQHVPHFGCICWFLVIGLGLYPLGRPSYHRSDSVSFSVHQVQRPCSWSVPLLETVTLVIVKMVPARFLLWKVILHLVINKCFVERDFETILVPVISTTFTHWLWHSLIHSLLLIGLQGILVCAAWPGLRTSAWELLHLVDSDLSRPLQGGPSMWSGVWFTTGVPWVVERKPEATVCSLWAVGHHQ